MESMSNLCVQLMTLILLASSLDQGNISLKLLFPVAENVANSHMCTHTHTHTHTRRT